MTAFAVGQRREMADTAVARRASIALACRAFGVSETCYRYGAQLKAETEVIANLLVGLTDARKTCMRGVLTARERIVRMCATMISAFRRAETPLSDQGLGQDWRPRLAA